MLRRIARFFTMEEMTAEEIMAESREVDRQDTRAAGARFGRGNISLQLNSVVTREDLERERAEIQTLHFPALT